VVLTAAPVTAARARLRGRFRRSSSWYTSTSGHAFCTGRFQWGWETGPGEANALSTLQSHSIGCYTPVTSWRPGSTRQAAAPVSGNAASGLRSEDARAGAGRSPAQSDRPTGRVHCPELPHRHPRCSDDPLRARHLPITGGERLDRLLPKSTKLESGLLLDLIFFHASQLMIGGITCCWAALTAREGVPNP
jgi:hypothetical protein